MPVDIFSCNVSVRLASSEQFRKVHGIIGGRSAGREKRNGSVESNQAKNPRKSVGCARKKLQILTQGEIHHSGTRGRLAQVTIGQPTSVSLDARIQGEARQSLSFLSFHVMEVVDGRSVRWAVPAVEGFVRLTCQDRREVNEWNGVGLGWTVQPKGVATGKKGGKKPKENNYYFGRSCARARTRTAQKLRWLTRAERESERERDI